MKEPEAAGNPLRSALSFFRRQENRGPRSWLLLSLGWLLVLIAYGPRLNAPYVWDDQALIAYNSGFDRPIPLKRYLTRDYFGFSQEFSWRPLSTLSYRAVIRIAGKSPAALRGFSLMIHFINGLLLLLALRKLGFAEEIAAIAAALFWLHPGNAESLMCAAFNKEPLCAMGLLLMAAAHQRSKPILAGFGFAVALLSKETGVAGLPLVALLDWLDARSGRHPRRKIAYGVYMGVLSAYLTVRFAYLPGLGGQIALSLPIKERLYFALEGFTAALRIFIFPAHLRLEYFALPPDSALDWIALCALSGASGAGIFFLGKYFLEKDRRWIFFWVWPWPFLAVTSNLIPAGVLNTRYLAERWLYLPFLGWSVSLAAALSLLKPRARQALAAGILLSWFSLSFSRAAEWSDETKLWESLAGIYPWSSKAHEGLGTAYFHQGNLPQALASFERAEQTRETRQDRVLAHYIPVAHGILRWESPSLYRWLGHCQASLGELSKAEESFRKAVALDPANEFPYRIMAYSLAQAGDFQRADAWARQGLKTTPQDPLLLRLKQEIDHRHLTLRISFH